MLRDSFFQPREKIIDEDDFFAPEPLEADHPEQIPPDLRDDQGRVPADAVLRRKSVVLEQYAKPPDTVAVNRNTKCIMYRIQCDVMRFVRVYLLEGETEHFVTERPAGMYTIERYVQECPGERITVTPWHNYAVVGPDSHHLPLTADQVPTTKKSEELIRLVEGDFGHNPPSSVDDLEDPDKATPDHPGLLMWRPRGMILRPLSSQGCSERSMDGDHAVLREGVLVWEPPLQIEGYTVTAVYREAIRVTRWTLATGKRTGAPYIEFTEPAVRGTRSWKIPGAKDKKETPVGG